MPQGFFGDPGVRENVETPAIGPRKNGNADHNQQQNGKPAHQTTPKSRRRQLRKRSVQKFSKQYLGRFVTPPPRNHTDIRPKLPRYSASRSKRSARMPERGDT
jgi:hypothetical protein